MALEELDKILSKFYAEVKKRDGDDYEPESVKTIQSAIKRYLKEKNCPLSIVRSREFHNNISKNNTTRYVFHRWRKNWSSSPFQALVVQATQRNER